MKNMIILIASIILVIVSGMFEVKYLERTSKYVESDLIYIMNLVENGQIDSAKNHINELNKTWHNVKYIWSYFINFSEIDSIDENIVRLSENLKNKDKDGSKVTASILIKSINKIPIRESIKLENII